MEKLVETITPQLALVRSGRPMVQPQVRHIFHEEEDSDVLYGEVVIEEQIHRQEAEARLPVCPYCKQCYGGTQYYGWVRDPGAVTGPHTGWRTPMKPCPICYPLAQEARRVAAAQKSQNVLQALFGDAHIPWYAQSWTFETFPKNAENQKALQVAREFVAEHSAYPNSQKKRGLYLAGLTGRMKTSLAISVLKEAMSARQEAGLYIMTLELMDRLKATYNKDSGGSITHDQLINAVCAVPWLLLDDLAVEQPTPYVIRMLYYILEKRRSEGLYTIFTSNLGTADLESYWRPEGVCEGEFHHGIRVIERIREYCVGVPMRGRNMRASDW